LLYQSGCKICLYNTLLSLRILTSAFGLQSKTRVLVWIRCSGWRTIVFGQGEVRKELCKLHRRSISLVKEKERHIDHNSLVPETCGLKTCILYGVTHKCRKDQSGTGGWQLQSLVITWEGFYSVGRFSLDANIFSGFWDILFTNACTS